MANSRSRAEQKHLGAESRSLSKLIRQITPPARNVCAPGLEIPRVSDNITTSEPQHNEVDITTNHSLQKYEEDKNEHQKHKHKIGIDPELLRWLSEEPTRLAKAREDMARWTRYMEFYQWHATSPFPKTLIKSHFSWQQ